VDEPGDLGVDLVDPDPAGVDVLEHWSGHV
jgi:hypothetical protein